MIGKILPHREQFGAITKYALYGRQGDNPERAEWVALRNLDGIDPDHAHLVMEATARQSKRVKKPRAHIVVSWAQGDNVTDAQMLSIMDKTLADLGYSEHQAIYVAHNDTDHQHVHAIINRVHPDKARVAKDSHERLRLRTSLIQQELEHDLQQTPFKSRGRQQLKTFSEIEIAKREQREPDVRMSKRRCDELREELAYCFEAAMGWNSFSDMLSRRGYDFVQSGHGARIMRHGSYAKLSDLMPPKLSVKKLQSQWGSLTDYWAAEERKLERQIQRKKSKQAEHQKQRLVFD